MYLNVATLYRIGPGPSSSQTVAPLEASRRFVHELAADGLIGRTARVRVELFGGLACTGRDLGAQRAVVAGLAGIQAASCDAPLLARCTADADNDRAIALGGRHRIDFHPARDVVFRVDQTLAYDGNALRYVAHDAAGERIAARVYFSTGDGAIVAQDEVGARRGPLRVPYAYSSAATLLEVARRHGKRIADVALANECVVQSPGEVQATLARVADAMRASIERGLATDGMLPGGRVRRAPAHADALRATQASATQWCAAFATAVAEENAAGGRIVAAPSNGAAGPVAAVLTHFRESTPLAGDKGVAEFLLAAAAIHGALRAQGLAQAGCQSEVGLAAAMAAAGYAAALGGANEHVLLAAELALEPHLGLACDPEGARIQQPCIERNAAAAGRAVTAAQNAVRSPAPRSAVDALARSMIERGRQMAGRYKQASLGGIAVNVADC
ncbi:MAG: L-serine ammonia-lyase [Betaproteobacteria bacterium]|nr:L-serine ammonia-lyase [Betaproteobacteria bacterium]MDH5286110.1 L-serine ammonia-lyase [Betaproteobacteria bacterium]